MSVCMMPGLSGTAAIPGGFGAGKTITQLAYTQHGGTVLWDDAGRHTNDPAAALAGLPDKARKAITDSAGKPLSEPQKKILLAHYRTIAPALEPIRKRIAKLDGEEKALRSQIRSTLVTLTAKPREIRVLPRGNWLDDGGPVVDAAVPDFLGTIHSEGVRASRLDFANWLVDPEDGVG